MNMLADADLPEADDEFSYREDPRPSVVDTPERQRSRLLAAAQQHAVDEWRRNPVIPLPPPIGYRPDRFETADSAPLPKRGAPKSDAPLVLCPVCRVALIVRKTVCVWCSTHGGAS